MKAAHTPGPWLTVSNTIYSLMHAGWRKGTEQFKNRFHAYVQADMDCPDDEHKANVLLIAAAPDLLAALQGVIRVADRKTDEFDAARAAVAKAIGATIPAKPKRNATLEQQMKDYDRKALAKAKRLIKGTEIWLEKDGDCFWVRFPEEDNEDSPIKGEQFCADGSDVLTAVEAVLAHQSKGEKS